MNKATRLALLAACESEKKAMEQEDYGVKSEMYHGDKEARFRDWSGREYHDTEYTKEVGQLEPYSTTAAYGRSDVMHHDKLTEEMAHEWMQDVHNEDGTKGAHWTLDQTKQVMMQKGVKADELDFWVVMNSLYADYCSVLKKHNVNTIDFYVDMACAWLNDKDAVAGKTAKYFEYIVE